MAGSMKWSGPQLQALIDAEMKRRLHAAGVVVHNHAKELVSVPGPAPSAPGEPPHMQGGRLRGSVAWEVAGMVCRVGTNVRYGRWLELGTSRVQARPWLRRALAERYAAITRLLTAKMF